MTRPGNGLPPHAEPPAGGDDGQPPGLKARTVAGFKWASLTAAGRVLLSLLIFMALARLLTPAEFGQIAIALVFVTLADAAGRRGIGPALVQRRALTRRHIATAFTLAIALGCLLAAALWALAPLVARLTGEPEVAPILRTLALVPVVAGLAVTPEHLLQRDLRFDRLMTATILSQALGYGLVAVVLALLGWGVWALAFGVLARHVLHALAVIACRPPPGLLFAPREARELLRVGAGFSAIALLQATGHQGVRLVVAHSLGAAALGLHSRGARIALAPARLGPVLRRVLFPAMARRQRHTGRFEPVHLLGIELLFMLACPAGLMMAAAAPEIVAVVLGPQWDAAAPVLRILALASAFQACNALHVSVIHATGAVYRETWRRALLLLLLVAGAWLGSRFGLAGVAAALAFASTVRYLLLSQLAVSLLGVPWRRYLAVHLPGLWVAAWAVPAALLAGRLAGEASLPAFAALPAALAAWAAAGAAAIWFAPPFARPAFPRWALAHLPLGRAGLPGRWLGAALDRLARRWPEPPPRAP